VNGGIDGTREETREVKGEGFCVASERKGRDMTTGGKRRRREREREEKTEKKERKGRERKTLTLESNKFFMIEYVQSFA
jgi:hypothetical protein